jgi:hypothetical protein
MVKKRRNKRWNNKNEILIDWYKIVKKVMMIDNKYCYRYILIDN